MTEREDFLERALRQTMADTASGLQPNAAGLNQIRTRIGGRPSRPYAVSVLARAVERLRYLTWPWAWPESLPRLTRPAVPAAAGPSGWHAPAHARRNNGPQWGLTGLRLTAALGVVAVVLGVSFGVQPFRHAIIQASSTVLNGGSGPQADGAGTDGNGSQAGGNGGSAAPGASPTDTSTRPGGSSGASNGALPGALAPTAGVTCVPASPSTTASPSATPTGTAALSDDQDGLATSCPAGSTAVAVDPSATDPDAYPTDGDGYPYDTASPAPTYSSPYWQRPGTSTPTDTPSPTPTDTDTDTGTATASPSPTDSGDSPSPTPSASSTRGGGGGGGGGGKPGKPGRPGH
jgi:hypothetical protein